MHVLDVHGRDAAHYPLGLIAHLDTRLELTFKYLPELFTHRPDRRPRRPSAARARRHHATISSLAVLRVQLLSPG